MNLNDPLLYPLALGVISVFVMFLEWRFPGHREPTLKRRTLWSDALHLVFNGHFLGVIIYFISTRYILPGVDAALGFDSSERPWYRDTATDWPLAIQILVAIVVIDFLQWGVHRLLHRVPLLWEFHKIHHSVADNEMNWIVAFRFHWMEAVLYKSLLFVPLAWFGFRMEALVIHAVFGTLIGHLNHANLNWDYGVARYLLNNPRMHAWHHDREADARQTVNFGIIFSLWDWLFKTAKLPASRPTRLGFREIEETPQDFFNHAIWPIHRVVPALARHPHWGAALGLSALIVVFIVVR